MKVGILTYHCVPNFGANLQALSTLSYLRKMGLEAEIINWYPKDLEAIYNRLVPEVQREKHIEFVNEYLGIGERLYSDEDVSAYIASNHFDMILIGSDAVFSYIPILKRIYPSRKQLIKYIKPGSDHCFPNPFWGSFQSKHPIRTRLLSGSAQYLDFHKCLPFERRQLKEALSKFDRITVRDRWTKKMIMSLGGSTDVEITPDPVFGLQKNFPDIVDGTIPARFGLDKRPYVLVSFCKQVWNRSELVGFKEKLNSEGIDVVNLSMPEGVVEVPSDITIAPPIGVKEWYNIIRGSQGYVGQRMHPMIVAMTCLRPFFIFDHYVLKGRTGDSSKIFDLIERAGLEEYYCRIDPENQPGGDEVAEKILNFNYSGEREFVDRYSSAYENFMSELVCV